MAIRITRFLPEIIHKDQAGFVPHRQAGDNVRRILNLQYLAHKAGSPMCLLALDIEKAFDTVEWPYLFMVLYRFGIKGRFTTLLRTYYESPTANLRLPGEHRAQICIQRVFLADDGFPWIPPPVEKVYFQIINDPTRSFEYLPSLGAAEFNRGATELLIGKDSIVNIENRACGVQTLGSTGALRVGAEFLYQWYHTGLQKPTVCISSITFEKHRRIFVDCGFTEVCSYRFWSLKKKGLALPEMLEDLKNAPDFSIVVLEAGCNLTGIHISNSVWEQIAEIMKSKNMFPFFIMKAQGLDSGYVDKDNWPLQHFIVEGFELFCAQSFSLNFGLYGQRVGNLTLVMKSNEVLVRVRSQLEKLVIAKWATAPATGARIVATILNNPTLYAEWKESLKQAVKCLMVTREKMKGRLRLLGTIQLWEHITNQTGMFSYLALTQAQIDLLLKRKHIYVHANGQINISCLNNKNLEYVMSGIHEITSVMAPSREN
ncbi:aspartate aminotransferase, cytoplasmic-like [Discoglossus pictus]